MPRDRDTGVSVRLIVVTLLWALCFPLIVLAGTEIPPLHLAAFRAGLAGVSLLGCSAILGRQVAVDGRAWGRLAGVGVFATGLGYLGMFRAGEFVSPGIATVISDSQPLIASIIAWFLLGERITIRGRIGLVVAFTGILVIASPQVAAAAPRASLVGYAYVILGAIGVAAGYVLMKRLPATFDSMTAMGWQLLLGAIPLAAGALMLEPTPTAITLLRLAPILFLLAIFGTALPFTIWFSVLRDLPLAQANAYTFLTSVFGLLIGLIFFGERLSWPQIVGVIVTLLGVYLAQRTVPHQRPPSSRGDLKVFPPMHLLPDKARTWSSGSGKRAIRATSGAPRSGRGHRGRLR